MKPNPRLAARRRAIKAAWRATGLDDDAYRAMLRNVADVASTTALDMAGADKVLDHINRQTGHVTRHPGKPGRVRPECAELITKVEALLADMKLPWQYGLTILKHNGADAWGFATADQMRNVVTALVVEQEKRLTEAAVVAALAAIGRDRSTGESIARALGAKRAASWHRDRDLMHRMLTHLQNVANATRSAP